MSRMIPRLQRLTISLHAEVEDYTKTGAEHLTLERISQADDRIDKHQLWRSQLMWIGGDKFIISRFV
jgi:hypothetical protein